VTSVDQDAEGFLDLTLTKVSDPASPDYGRYLNQDMVDTIIRRSDDEEAAIAEWMRPACSTVVSRGPGGFLTCESTVDEIATLLETEYRAFRSTEDPSRIVHRAANYSVPDELAGLISFVEPTIRFPFRDHSVPASRKRAAPTVSLSTHERHASFSSDVSADISITPRFLRELYQVDKVQADATVAKTLSYGIASFLGQYYDEVDLQEFFTALFQEAIGTEPTKVIGDNGLAPGVEANLDVQYGMAVGFDYSDNFWVYSTAGSANGNQEPFLKWAAIVSGEDDATVPKVISISYGDVESTISGSFLDRLTVAFKGLGARGISLLFAAGDSGAACASSGAAFAPDFPASSPFVTTVGGTEMSGALETGHEIVNYIGGSGFSNHFTRPAYQDATVSAYLAANATGILPPFSFFNQTSRAYPDIALQSSGFLVADAGIIQPVGGTSCAAPTAAGVFTAVNNARLAAGKPLLGFLNPLLYSLSGKGFFDITEGCNAGCYNNQGFCAVPGWDAASGLGAPRAKDLLTALSS
jgi:tripeptidyl-peptidase-1